jgi:RHS repeat-associated protein
LPTTAATFNGNARLQVTDATGGLSWNSGASKLTVQCWFKLSVPSATNLIENMTILVNRSSGSANDPHAFLIEFDIHTGNIEFSSRGSGFRRFTLVERPFLDRWYHVAVARQNEEFSAYVDGRDIKLPAGAAVGDTRNTDGLSIGGWNASGSQGQCLWGEVQEVSIYQDFLAQEFITQNMFANQPAIPELKGYFKLGFSTNTTDQLKNFAAAPVPAGTETASKDGPVQFEEANQAGEQSSFDARRNGGRDATAPLSGAFSWEQVAFARPTPGIAFDFRFGYSSANGAGGAKLGGIDPFAAGPLGKGWRHTFETRVLPAQTFSPLSDTDTLGLLLWNGALETWDLDNTLGEYRPRQGEYKGEMVITTTNCQWTTPDRLVYVFKRPDTGSAVMRGRLTEIRDFSANRVQLQWDETRGRLTNVTDSVGGIYAFDTNSLLRTLTFGAWQVNFGYDPTNRLVSKTLTNNASNASGVATNVNTTWRFAYNATNGLLESIIDPRGNTNVVVQYDQYGRQTNIVDALGRANSTEYGVPGKRQVRRTDPAGFVWLETYDRKGHILAQQDPLTNITAYTYDDRGNRTSITEPLGWATRFGYDERANVIARTNALGEITRWTFHPFFNKATGQIAPQPPDLHGWTTWTNFYAYDAGGNLTNHADALGTLVSYTYRTNGLLETATDANGHTTSFDYDANGFLISKTDAADNTWTYTVNGVGWRLTETTPLFDTAELAYDLNGNAVQRIDPLNRTFTKIFDPNGNLLAESDGKGAFTHHAYDAANQRTNMVDRSGTNRWTYAFTSRGKLGRAIDPLGNTSTNLYDNANRLVVLSDPLGNTVSNRYDGNGNLIALFDVLGRQWSKTFDPLGRVVAETNPLGDTRRTSYDSAGRIKELTTPKGYISTHEYDGRGRLTRWVEPETWRGSPITWLYDYDGVGNITNITDAMGGHYVMTYGPRNERLSELNQDGRKWEYTYDELLRLQTQRDPNGIRRTRDYDSVSRPTSVIWSTGREDTFDYDANDNPTVISRRPKGAPPVKTILTYDSLDRITRTVAPDLNGPAVDYGFDALSRVATIVYPGNRTLAQAYDAVGRLTNQVDWAGRQTAYGYDKAGRLINRSYPNGVTQSNTFDEAGQIRGLTYSTPSPQPATINVALTYAYDRNGNKVGGGEKGTLAWPLPTPTDETATYTAAGRLQERQVSGSPSDGPASITYAYDPSGNMTNAVQTVGGTNSQSWALTYAEDYRTTSIRWSAGVTNTQILNQYDALGRRISRSVDGQATRYVLDLSGSMERILCDLNPDGTTNWYVHGPDLCYRVDSSNNLVCYHADALANIIALTGANGTNLAQYAYTPYGRSLVSTNSQPSALSSQPFRFVGSQGVMEELPGLYFMRARYYSADAGVFLSTDPVKKIGPGWKPAVYAYAGGDPLGMTDASGEVVEALLLALAPAILRKIDRFYGNCGGPGLRCTSVDQGRDQLDKLFAQHDIDFAQAEGAVTYGDAVEEARKANRDLAARIGGLDRSSLTANERIHAEIAQAVFGSGIADIYAYAAFLPKLFSGSSSLSTLSSPTAVTTPMAYLKPLQTSPMTLGLGPAQISSDKQSLGSRTADAGSYAQTQNNRNQRNPSGSSNGNGTTTQSNINAGSQSGGGNAFSQVVNRVNSAVSSAASSITQAVKNVTTTVAQAVSKVVTSIGNVLGGIFGRRP